MEGILVSVMKWIAPKDEEAERLEITRKERLKAIAMEHIEAATARMRAADEAGHPDNASNHSNDALCWWQTITGQTSG